jgi:hypothetical protein
MAKRIGQYNCPLFPLPISRQSPQIDRGNHRGLEQIPTETDIEVSPRGSELLVAEPVENEQRQIFHDYSRRNRIRRPVRVEMTNSKGNTIIIKTVDSSGQ